MGHFGKNSPKPPPLSFVVLFGDLSSVEVNSGAVLGINLDVTVIVNTLCRIAGGFYRVCFHGNNGEYDSHPGKGGNISYDGGNDRCGRTGRFDRIQ